MPTITDHRDKKMLSVDPIFLVSGECLAITSAMRKNARWANSGVSSILRGPSDTEGSGGSDIRSRLGLRTRAHDGDHLHFGGGSSNGGGSSSNGGSGSGGSGSNMGRSSGADDPLIEAFARLRVSVSQLDSLDGFDMHQLFLPFIEVIRSPSTTGPITAMAITAVNKLFDYGIVRTNSVNLQQAVCQLSIAITHCRFDATDQADDDAVLLKILKLMDTLVGGSSGDLLNDESMCEIFETCLSMACQLRRSNVLRRSAENTILDITQKAFSKLQRLEPEQDIPVGAPLVHDDVVVNVPSVIGDIVVDTETAETAETAETVEKTAEEVLAKEGKDSSENDAESKNETFGIPSIREFYRVLTSILDPANHHQYTESTRVMSLQLINVVFEVAGTHITKHHSLLQITTDTLCKHLFRIIRMDSLPLVQAALRVISTMLHTTRSHLKLQQEFLLVYFMSCCCPLDDPSMAPDGSASGITVPSILLEKNFNYSNTQLGDIGPSKSSTPRPDSSSPGADSPAPRSQAQFATSRSPEIREAMVETLSTLCREPFFFAELFLNFDCDVDRVNLCENMMQFLCRSAYPDAAQWSSSSVPPFCLDVVLQHLSKLVNRLDLDSSDPETIEHAKELIAKKARKKEIVEAIDAFNNNPKVGLQKFVSGGMIKDTSATEVGAFLFQSSRINKAKLGEFLSKPANLPTLKAYTAQFDFDGKRVDMAMRQYLSAFRLPGESQQIERVMECFAEHYSSFSANQSVVKNANDGVVLCFSVIMLNTDLHNPVVKNHMSLDQYKRNLRGQCDGKDYDEDFLESIYHDIKTREIILPEEQDTNESFEHIWDELIMKAGLAGHVTTTLNSNVFDRHVFEVTWRPIVAMLTRVFAAATDDAVFGRVVSALDQLARLASDYELDEVIHVILDRVGHVMASLGEPIDVAQNIDVFLDPGEPEPITVSDLSVQFGLDFKAQIATVVYFTIVANHSDHVNDDGFSFVAKILNNIYLNGLHPIPLFGGFTENSKFAKDLPRVRAPNKFKKYESGGKEGVGLLSTLSSYLTGGYSEPNQPSDEEIEATLSAVDCLVSCKIPQLFAKLNGEAPAKLVNSLVSIPSLYSLHLMALLGESNEHVAPLVIQRFEESLNDSADGATINYLAGLQSDRSKLFQQILAVDSEVLRSLSGDFDTLMLSFAPSDLQNSDYLEILKILASNVDSSPRVFELVKTHVTDIPSTNLISILDEIVSVASVGAPLEQKGLSLASLSSTSGEKEFAKIAKSKNMAKTVPATLEHVVRGLRALEVAQTASGLDSASYIEFLAHQSYNPCRRIRSETLKALERLLSDKSVYSADGFSWSESVFENGLFPLVTELLKPEVYELDSSGMGKTRAAAAMLLCKTFLHYVDAVSDGVEGGEEASGGVSHSETIKLWLKMLEMLDRLVNSSSDAQESLVESLKNVLLVLVSSKHLDPENGGKDWDDSWNRLDQFVPGLRTDLFPESKEPEVVRRD